MKEGRWFVASCSTLDIATQGKTEQEVKENTLKPEKQTITNLSFIIGRIPKKRLTDWKTQAA